MRQTCALYGFEFTRTFSACGLTFHPLSTDYSVAQSRARDLSAHNLTGTVSGGTLDDEKRYHIEGVLSFIEHLSVLVSEPINTEAAIDRPESHFVTKIGGWKRHNGGGAVVGSDAFNPYRDSRQQFIDLALAHLANTQFCQRTRFNSLFFKCVETFRQRRPFLEISYFLLFSGLEAFARAVQNDCTRKNASVPITRMLQGYGFGVHQDNPNDLPRSMSTYMHIRNALFHQGDFSTTVQMNSSSVKLDSVEYLFHLSMLVSLTIMKAIGFDDQHTNWDCWIDRQLLR